MAAHSYFEKEAIKLYHFSASGAGENYIIWQVIHMSSLPKWPHFILRYINLSYQMETGIKRLHAVMRQF